MGRVTVGEGVDLDDWSEVCLVTTAASNWLAVRWVATAGDWLVVRQLAGEGDWLEVRWVATAGDWLVVRQLAGEGDWLEVRWVATAGDWLVVRWLAGEGDGLEVRWVAGEGDWSEVRWVAGTEFRSSWPKVLVSSSFWIDKMWIDASGTYTDRSSSLSIESSNAKISPLDNLSVLTYFFLALSMLPTAHAKRLNVSVCNNVHLFCPQNFPTLSCSHYHSQKCFEFSQ